MAKQKEDTSTKDMYTSRAVLTFTQDLEGLTVEVLYEDGGVEEFNPECQAHQVMFLTANWVDSLGMPKVSH